MNIGEDAECQDFLTCGGEPKNTSAGIRQAPHKRTVSR